MIMALGAFHCETKPDIGGRFYSVDDIADAQFFRDRAALVGGRMITVKPCRNFLRQGWIGQQVAGQLLDGKLVVGLIIVVGIDHPVAPRPHISGAISMHDRGVAIAGCIEPHQSHTLTEIGRCQ